MAVFFETPLGLFVCTAILILAAFAAIRINRTATLVLAGLATVVFGIGVLLSADVDGKTHKPFIYMSLYAWLLTVLFLGLTLRGQAKRAAAMPPKVANLGMPAHPATMAHPYGGDFSYDFGPSPAANDEHGDFPYSRPVPYGGQPRQSDRAQGTHGTQPRGRRPNPQEEPPYRGR